jgi:CelD/BcsL family acetyltransferase involved in cellulose biosynthesis
MEHAYRTGAKSVDFLAGDFEYKRRWTEETRTVLDLEGYAPWSWRARVFLFLRRFRRGLKRKDLVPEAAPEEGEA